MNKREQQEADALQRSISKVLAAKKDLAIRLSKGRYSKGVRDEAEKERRKVRQASRLTKVNTARQSNEARAANEAVAARFRQAGDQ